MSAIAIEPLRTGTVAEPEREAVILTPDQRVRVFISSTLAELAEAATACGWPSSCT